MISVKIVKTRNNDINLKENTTRPHWGLKKKSSSSLEEVQI